MMSVHKAALQSVLRFIEEGGDGWEATAERLIRDALTTPPQPADGGDRVKELVDQMQCTQSMIEHIERCEQWFREGAGMASYEELMTWCDNLMSCVTPRKTYNEAALAKFQPAGGENDGR